MTKASPITLDRVQELQATYRPILDEIPKGENFPELNTVAKCCLEPMAQAKALRTSLMNGAEAVGFLLKDRSKQ